MRYPKRVTVIELENAPFRGAKTTLKRHVDPNEKTKAYSHVISNIEVLKGVAGFVTRSSDRTSMDVNVLLNGVCDVNGEPLLGKKCEHGSYFKIAPLH